MTERCAMLVGVGCLMAATASLGATGEQVYRAKCSACHDGGAGGAPRITDQGAWAQRVAMGRAEMYRIAMEGKADTAMMPKGGYAALTREEVLAAVDYMLLQIGYRESPSPQMAASPARAAVVGSSSAASVAEDGVITARVAEALRKAASVSPPGAKIETHDGLTIVRGAGIKVQTRDGVVTLSGLVQGAKIVQSAEEIARSVDGVKNVDNKLISASLFEWD